MSEKPPIDRDANKGRWSEPGKTGGEKKQVLRGDVVKTRSFNLDEVSALEEAVLNPNMKSIDNIALEYVPDVVEEWRTKLLTKALSDIAAYSANEINLEELRERLTIVNERAKRAMISFSDLAREALKRIKRVNGVITPLTEEEKIRGQKLQIMKRAAEEVNRQTLGDPKLILLRQTRENNDDLTGLTALELQSENKTAYDRLRQRQAWLREINVSFKSRYDVDMAKEEEREAARNREALQKVRTRARLLTEPEVTRVHTEVRTLRDQPGQAEAFEAERKLIHQTNLLISRVDRMLSLLKSGGEYLRNNTNGERERQNIRFDERDLEQLRSTLARWTKEFNDLPKPTPEGKGNAVVYKYSYEGLSRRLKQAALDLAARAAEFRGEGAEILSDLEAIDAQSKTERPTTPGLRIEPMDLTQPDLNPVEVPSPVETDIARTELARRRQILNETEARLIGLLKGKYGDDFDQDQLEMWLRDQRPLGARIANKVKGFFRSIGKWWDEKVEGHNLEPDREDAINYYHQEYLKALDNYTRASEDMDLPSTAGYAMRVGIRERNAVTGPKGNPTQVHGPGEGTLFDTSHTESEATHRQRDYETRQDKARHYWQDRYTKNRLIDEENRRNRKDQDDLTPEEEQQEREQAWFRFGEEHLGATRRDRKAYSYELEEAEAKESRIAPELKKLAVLRFETANVLRQLSDLERDFNNPQRGPMLHDRGYINTLSEYTRGLMERVSSMPEPHELPGLAESGREKFYQQSRTDLKDDLSYVNDRLNQAWNRITDVEEKNKQRPPQIQRPWSPIVDDGPEVTLTDMSQSEEDALKAEVAALENPTPRRTQPDGTPIVEPETAPIPLVKPRGRKPAPPKDEKPTDDGRGGRGVLPVPIPMPIPSVAERNKGKRKGGGGGGAGDGGNDGGHRPPPDRAETESWLRRSANGLKKSRLAKILALIGLLGIAHDHSRPRSGEEGAEPNPIVTTTHREKAKSIQELLKLADVRMEDGHMVIDLTHGKPGSDHLVSRAETINLGPTDVHYDLGRHGMTQPLIGEDTALRKEMERSVRLGITQAMPQLQRFGLNANDLVRGVHLSVSGTASPEGSLTVNRGYANERASDTASSAGRTWQERYHNVTVDAAGSGEAEHAWGELRKDLNSTFNLYAKGNTELSQSDLETIVSARNLGNHKAIARIISEHGGNWVQDQFESAFNRFAGHRAAHVEASVQTPEVVVRVPDGVSVVQVLNALRTSS